MAKAFWFRRWQRLGDTTALVGNNWFRRWVRRQANDLAGEAWFRRAVARGEVAAEFDIFVDSVAGDDAAAGNEAAPIQTLTEAASRAENGTRIGLKRGGFWEDTLDVSLLSDVVVDDYGDAEDPMPTIDTTNVATNGDFSATGGTSNVFEIAWAHDITGSISFLRVWEDGDALVFATSVANCDATPGSCWYDGVASENDPLTVYVHPKGGTDPTSDGKEYRLSARNNCIKMGANNTIRDVLADKCCGSDGMISGSDGGLMERCVLRWCGKHGTVQGTGGTSMQFKDCIAYLQIPTAAQWGGGVAAFTVNEDTAAGGAIIVDGCVIYDPNSQAGGFFSHTNVGGTWASEVYRNCYVFGLTNAGFTNSPVDQTTEIQDCYGEECPQLVTAFADTDVDGLTVINPVSGWQAIAISAEAVTVVANDLACYGTVQPTGGAMIGGGANEYDLTLQNCTLRLGAGIFETTLISTDAATVVSVHDCIIDGNNVADLAGADPWTGDRNVFRGVDGGPWWTTDSTLKTGLVQWQPASGEDANSAEGDPLYAGDLAAGDFSLQAGSPAFTGGRNAGARKWRTQPDWTALRAQWDAGFYAHPTDDVGGSQLVIR